MTTIKITIPGSDREFEFTLDEAEVVHEALDEMFGVMEYELELDDRVVH